MKENHNNYYKTRRDINIVVWYDGTQLCIADRANCHCSWIALIVLQELYSSISWIHNQKQFIPMNKINYIDTYLAPNS